MLGTNPNGQRNSRAGLATAIFQIVFGIYAAYVLEFPIWLQLVIKPPSPDALANALNAALRGEHGSCAGRT